MTTPLTPAGKVVLLELLLSTQIHGRLSETIRLAIEKAETLEDVNYSLASSIQELHRANQFVVKLVESGRGIEATK